MKRSFLSSLDIPIYGLTFLFALDRLLKMAAVIHFFRRSQPPAPSSWPAVTLLQPITRGTCNLLAALRTRALLDYPATVQHLLICDANDFETRATVSSYLSEFKSLQAEVIQVESSGGAIATKMRKLQAALPRATGDVLCFVDDDVALRPRTLKVLLPYLFQPGVGLAFGFPCFTNWQTVWSSLISGLVNAHMLLSFAALTYLTKPIRINGHIFAFRKQIFRDVGGFDGLEQYIDDEYTIAQRLRVHHLHAVQTPLIYDIDNSLNSYRAYMKQFKRWFVMPRQAMLPTLTPKEKLLASIGSVGLPLPGVIALLALLTRRRSAFYALGAILTLFGTTYALTEQCYLQRHMPLRRWPLLLIVALGTPIHILWTYFLSNEVEWRGQRLRLHRDGTVEILS
jgi:cellulose synthase/poly-beta-1,6-N-acetylglucosamine synthase-like glycosyltransferase